MRSEPEPRSSPGGSGRGQSVLGCHSVPEGMSSRRHEDMQNQRAQSVRRWEEGESWKKEVEEPWGPPMAPSSQPAVTNFLGLQEPLCV